MFGDLFTRFHVHVKRMLKQMLKPTFVTVHGITKWKRTLNDFTTTSATKLSSPMHYSRKENKALLSDQSPRCWSAKLESDTSLTWHTLMCLGIFQQIFFERNLECGGKSRCFGRRQISDRLGECKVPHSLKRWLTESSHAWTVAFSCFKKVKK